MYLVFFMDLVYMRAQISKLKGFRYFFRILEVIRVFRRIRAVGYSGDSNDNV